MRKPNKVRAELSQPRLVSRREVLRLALSAGALAFTGGIAMADTTIQRPIPRSTGESLPVIGLGTWQTFDVGKGQSGREPLKAVLGDFVRLHGKVIDSSPMYGNSESVVGDLAVELGVQKQLFLATKVWTSGRDAGIRQMEESFRRLRTQVMDLMQVHNLVDWQTHLATLRRWKEQGRVRYIGVTHYTASAYDQLARVLETEDLDFVQLNYSIVERDAERRLLPMAADRRIAVLVNRPFAAGRIVQPITRQTSSAIGQRDRLRYLGTILVEVCDLPPSRHLRHPRDEQSTASDRQHAGRGRNSSEP